MADSDDDVPLGALAAAPAASARRGSKRARTKPPPPVDSDSEDEAFVEAKPSKSKKARKAPAAKKGAAGKKAGAGKKTPKKTPKKAASKAGKGKKAAVAKAGKVKELKPLEELEAAMKAHKWWEEEEHPEGIQWASLEHNGVIFPEPYTPHGVKLLYKGAPVDLTPAQEELATFYAQMPLDGPQLGDPTVAPRFNANFFRDFRAALGPGHVVQDFEHCGWDALRAEVTRAREQRKARSKEVKEAEKAVKDALVMRQGFALVDGHVQRVGNYTIEPPGLFRGRGQHPRTGTVKRRVPAERISINVSDMAAVPACPAAGHAWKAVVHDPAVTWLAYWKENVMGAQKYVYLAASSGFKGKSDRDKYEKARKLKAFIGRIRTHYTAALRRSDEFERQCGTAMWVIDRLALRVGGEKDDDEADTVGCCSLRVEHLTFGQPPPEEEGDSQASVSASASSGASAGVGAGAAAAAGGGSGPDLRVTLDFLGKDSMRYFQTIDLARYGDIGAAVFKNLKHFAKGKAGPADLFDKLSPSSLNGELQKLMPGLSAKVFRTYNASVTLQAELPWDMPLAATDAEKTVEYNRANREVSILCNHQRTVPKGFAAAYGKLQERVALLEKQAAELRKMLRARKAGKDVKTKREVPKGKDLTAKQKAIKAADSHLWTKQPAADAVSKRLKSWEEKLAKSRLDMRNKDENKTVALGTAKINYMDPRITVAWCKAVECPIERVFPKALRDKFPWACGVASTWKF